MNQVQIQQDRRLEKATILVNKRVRRSTLKESRNIWMVGSFSTPKKKWYVVRWNEEFDCFTCACKAFEYSSDNMCLHILACALFEGTAEEVEEA